MSSGYLKSDKHDITNTEGTKNNDTKTITFKLTITKRPLPISIKTSSLVLFQLYSLSTTVITKGFKNLYLNQTPAISVKVLTSLKTLIRLIIYNIIKKDSKFLVLI